MIINWLCVLIPAFVILIPLVSVYLNSRKNYNCTPSIWRKFGERSGLKITQATMFEDVFASGIYQGYEIKFSFYPIGGYEFGCFKIFILASLRLNKNINGSFTIVINNLSLPGSDLRLKNKQNIQFIMTGAGMTPRTRDFEEMGLVNKFFQSDITHVTLNQNEITIRKEDFRMKSESLCNMLEILVDIAVLVESQALAFQQM